ncbi:hypothetical protein F5880DRAFT_576549 [Lentinula raphanica]|nr:hypothetical protein F5880DRAFT_576549 [Lentinula raphanica]
MYRIVWTALFFLVVNEWPNSGLHATTSSLVSLYLTLFTRTVSANTMIALYQPNILSSRDSARQASVSDDGPITSRGMELCLCRPTKPCGILFENLATKPRRRLLDYSSWAGDRSS